MNAPTKILTQLRLLAQDTETEAQVARSRAGQARNEAVRDELLENAANADRRTKLIVHTYRDLGGAPDLVARAIGRLNGTVKSVLAQPMPLDEALLEDLVLEHRLLDRARYLRALAEGAELPRVGELAEHLIEAHQETVQWIHLVLTEEALGGPSALRATPVQRAAGGVSRVLNLPGQYAVKTVDATVDTAQQGAEQTRESLSALAQKASRLSSAVLETLSAGRNASLQQAEDLAAAEGRRSTAHIVHDVRRDLGALRPSELPIARYDNLTVVEAAKAIKKLSRVEDVRTVIAYEEAHAARAGALKAAHARVAALAEESVAVG